MSTDMAVHFDFINDLKRRYNTENPFSLQVKEDVKMMATSLVKCSDISNVVRIPKTPHRRKHKISTTHALFSFVDQAL